MQTFILHCNLAILGEYLDSAKGLIRRAKERQQSIEDYPISFEIKALADSTLSYWEELVRALPEDMEPHAANLYYILDELLKDIDFNLIELTEVQSALDALRFLEGLLKIRESKRTNFILRIQQPVKTPLVAEARLNNQFQLDSDLLEHLINYIKKVRLSNQVLFTAIQPTEFNAAQVHEAIKLMTNAGEQVYKAKFQLGHYCLILIKYFNKEIERNDKNSKFNAKQLHLIYEMLTILNLSHYIINPDDLPSEEFSKRRKTTIYNRIKKFLENHHAGLDSDYHKSYNFLN